MRTTLSICCLLGLLIALPLRAAETLTLFAASSLAQTLERISADYTQAHGVKIRTVYAASSTLARQIAQGAPADLYLSAHPRWMDYLAEQQAIDSTTRINLLRNTLVVIAPANSPLTPFAADKHWPITTQLQGGRLAAADPAHVPAGLYLKETLQALNLWTLAEPHLTRSNNVRSALVLVERNEAPMGVVYASDAKASSKVKILANINPALHSPIIYPLAITAQAANNADAQHFYHYLQSQSALTQFQQDGFAAYAE